MKKLMLPWVDMIITLRDQCRKIQKIVKTMTCIPPYKLGEILRDNVLKTKIF